jgi:transposase
MSDPVSPPATQSRRDPAATRRRWAERLARFRRSGQTIAQFCAAEEVSVPSFYVWKRTLASGGVPAPPASAPTLVPIRLTPSPATPIELTLPSGTVVRFPADTRPELLIAILRGLEESPC